MNRQLHFAFSLIGLMLVIWVATACATPTPTPIPTLLPTPTSTPPPTFTPVPVATLEVTKPTPAIVVGTTARPIDPSIISALNANPTFNIPDNTYLLLTFEESEEICMTNCRCPEPRDENWSDLDASRQRQIMRNMIQQGARGFILKIRTQKISGCACTIRQEQFDPIKSLALVVGDIILDRVEQDGTGIARIGNGVYAFKPGNTWSYMESILVTNRSGLEWCKSFTHIKRSSFQYSGLLDKKKILGE